MRSGRRTRRSLLGASSAAALLVLLGSLPASGAPVAIDTFVFDAGAFGPSQATFDAQGDAHYIPMFGAPCMTSSNGYTPTYAGATPLMSDAFDGGLFLEVRGNIFNPGETGEGVGEQLTTGPLTLGGLQVTRIERALPDYPALRSLIKLKNPATHDVRPEITWDSAAGADGLEATRTSSNGDAALTVTDRWAVSSDDAVSPSDAVILFVMRGKGQVTKLSSVPYPPEGPDPAGAEGCIVMRFKPRIPTGSTRYLLLFTELWDSNGAAAGGATKYNDPDLNAKLLADLSLSVRKKILNWDVA